MFMEENPFLNLMPGINESISDIEMYQSDKDMCFCFCTTLISTVWIVTFSGKNTYVLCFSFNFSPIG